VRRLPRSPDAGPFSAPLEAVGHVKTRGASITTRHRFAADHIESAWTVALARRGLFAELLFPSWGGSGASITAVLHDGTSVGLAAGESIDVSAVAFFHLAGPRGGYALTFPRGAAGLARAVRVARQPAAPRPGPTLVLPIAPDAEVRARIAPAASLDRAREIAARLR
jgi:hypothetical protein